MERRIGRSVRMLGGVAVAAVLAFGSRQAFAAPAAEARVQACVPSECDLGCKAQGADGGICTRAGNCLCFVRDGLAPTSAQEGR